MAPTRFPDYEVASNTSVYVSSEKTGNFDGKVTVSFATHATQYYHLVIMRSDNTTVDSAILDATEVSIGSHAEKVFILDITEIVNDSETFSLKTYASESALIADYTVETEDTLNALTFVVPTNVNANFYNYSQYPMDNARFKVYSSNGETSSGNKEVEIAKYLLTSNIDVPFSDNFDNSPSDMSLGRDLYVNNMEPEFAENFALAFRHQDTTPSNVYQAPESANTANDFRLTLSDNTSSYYDSHLKITVSDGLADNSYLLSSGDDANVFLTLDPSTTTNVNVDPTVADPYNLFKKLNATAGGIVVQGNTNTNSSALMDFENSLYSLDGTTNELSHTTGVTPSLNLFSVSAANSNVFAMEGTDYSFHMDTSESNAFVGAMKFVQEDVQISVINDNDDPEALIDPVPVSSQHIMLHNTSDNVALGSNMLEDGDVDTALWESFYSNADLANISTEAFLEVKRTSAGSVSLPNTNILASIDDSQMTRNIRFMDMISNHTNMKHTIRVTNGSLSMSDTSNGSEGNAVSSEFSFDETVREKLAFENIEDTGLITLAATSSLAKETASSTSRSNERAYYDIDNSSISVGSSMALNVFYHADESGNSSGTVLDNGSSTAYDVSYEFTNLLPITHEDYNNYANDPNINSSSLVNRSPADTNKKWIAISTTENFDTSNVEFTEMSSADMTTASFDSGTIVLMNLEQKMVLGKESPLYYLDVDGTTETTYPNCHCDIVLTNADLSSFSFNDVRARFRMKEMADFSNVDFSSPSSIAVSMILDSNNNEDDRVRTTKDSYGLMCNDSYKFLHGTDASVDFNVQFLTNATAFSYETLTRYVTIQYTATDAGLDTTRTFTEDMLTISESSSVDSTPVELSDYSVPPSESGLDATLLANIGSNKIMTYTTTKEYSVQMPFDFGAYRNILIEITGITEVSTRYFLQNVAGQRLSDSHLSAYTTDGLPAKNTRTLTTIPSGTPETYTLTLLKDDFYSLVGRLEFTDDNFATVTKSEDQSVDPHFDVQTIFNLYEDQGVDGTLDTSGSNKVADVNVSLDLVKGTSLGTEAAVSMNQDDVGRFQYFVQISNASQSDVSFDMVAKYYSSVDYSNFDTNWSSGSPFADRENFFPSLGGTDLSPTVEVTQTNDASGNHFPDTITLNFISSDSTSLGSLVCPGAILGNFNFLYVPTTLVKETSTISGSSVSSYNFMDTVGSFSTLDAYNGVKFTMTNGTSVRGDMKKYVLYGDLLQASLYNSSDYNTDTSGSAYISQEEISTTNGLIIGSASKARPITIPKYRGFVDLDNSNDPQNIVISISRTKSSLQYRPLTSLDILIDHEHANWGVHSSLTNAVDISVGNTMSIGQINLLFTSADSMFTSSDLTSSNIIDIVLDVVYAKYQTTVYYGDEATRDPDTTTNTDISAANFVILDFTGSYVNSVVASTITGHEADYYKVHTGVPPMKIYQISTVSGDVLSMPFSETETQTISDLTLRVGRKIDNTSVTITRHVVNPGTFTKYVLFPPAQVKVTAHDTSNIQKSYWVDVDKDVTSSLMKPFTNDSDLNDLSVSFDGNNVSVYDFRNGYLSSPITFKISSNKMKVELIVGLVSETGTTPIQLEGEDLVPSGSSISDLSGVSTNGLNEIDSRGSTNSNDTHESTFGASFRQILSHIAKVAPTVTEHRNIHVSGFHDFMDTGIYQLDLQNNNSMYLELYGLYHDDESEVFTTRLVKYTTAVGTNFTLGSNDFLSDSIQSLNFVAHTKHISEAITTEVPSTLSESDAYNLQSLLSDEAGSLGSSVTWYGSADWAGQGISDSFVQDTTLNFKLVCTTKMGQKKLTELASVSTSDSSRVLIAHLPAIMKFFSPDGSVSMMLTANGRLMVPSISTYTSNSYPTAISNTGASEFLAYNVERMRSTLS